MLENTVLVGKFPSKTTTLGARKSLQFQEILRQKLKSSALIISSNGKLQLTDPATFLCHDAADNISY